MVVFIQLIRQLASDGYLEISELVSRCLKISGHYYLAWTDDGHDMYGLDDGGPYKPAGIRELAYIIAVLGILFGYLRSITN